MQGTKIVNFVHISNSYPKKNVFLFVLLGLQL